MKWSDEFLDRKRQLADPLADGVVERIVLERGEKEAFHVFDLLIRNIEMPVSQLPDEVTDFIHSTNQLPDWTDLSKIRLTRELFLDHGPKFLLFLYYKSLPLLYTDKKGAEVLVRTSRLTHNIEDITIFTRRIAETGQFMIDVMSDGGLNPGGRGIRSIQKVRLIHAVIRRFVKRSEWDIDTLGEPINQEDMALTLMTFSISPITALQQIGIHESEELLDAYLHTWCAIGEILGINRDVLPGTLEDAQQLLDKILERQSGSSDAGKLLAKALVQFSRETFPRDRLDDAPVYIIRSLIGRERADMLDVYPKYSILGIAVPLFLRRLFNVAERLEDKIDGPVRIVIDRVSDKMVRAMVGYFDTYKQRKFSIPDEMENRWF